MIRCSAVAILSKILSDLINHLAHLRPASTRAQVIPPPTELIFAALAVPVKLKALYEKHWVSGPRTALSSASKYWKCPSLTPSWAHDTRSRWNLPMKSAGQARRLTQRHKPGFVSRRHVDGLTILGISADEDRLSLLPRGCPAAGFGGCPGEYCCYPARIKPRSPLYTTTFHVVWLSCSNGNSQVQLSL